MVFGVRRQPELAHSLKCDNTNSVDMLTTSFGHTTFSCLPHQRMLVNRDRFDGFSPVYFGQVWIYLRRGVDLYVAGVEQKLVEVRAFIDMRMKAGS